MQITESQLRQKVKLLLKEEVYGTIATVYHGSRQPPEEFLKVFETGDLSSYASTGWKPGKGLGSAYGHGLYSVWAKTLHQTFSGGYGEWIYKFKVNLYGFIIFDEDVCQKVYKKSITPLEQMKLLGKENEIRKASEGEIRVLSQPPVKGARSANLADSLSDFLKGRVNGIVFFGHNDGPVVLIYDPDIATPLAWTKRDTNTGELAPWTPWNASEIKQSLKRASHAGLQANAERLQTKSFDTERLEKIANDLFAVSNVYYSLSEQQKTFIMKTTTNKDVLTKFADDKSDNIRFQVAANKNASEEALNKLVDDKNFDVRWHVAINKNTSKEALNKLAVDKHSEIRASVASNHKISAETLVQLANDKSFDVRRSAAQNTNAEVLNQLSGDKNISVRIAVASNKNTPPAALMKLANEESKSILNAIASNEGSPEEVIMKLAAREEKDIRLTIANSTKYTNVLVKLSKDLLPSVRLAVTHNMKTPAEILSQLAGSKETQIRTGVAYNINTQPETLSKLSQDKQMWPRWGVAGNPNTPVNILMKLANDKEENVKAKALRTLQSRQSINELKSLIRHCI
jgi:hypothetical protein